MSQVEESGQAVILRVRERRKRVKAGGDGRSSVVWLVRWMDGWLAG